MARRLFYDLKLFLNLEAEDNAEKYGLALASTLRTKCTFAMRSGQHRRGAISTACRPNLWLVINEVGGWTAMYTEDY